MSCTMLLGCLVFGMLVGMHPIVYCEPQGGGMDPPNPLPPLIPPAVCSYQTFALFAKSP